MPSSRATLPQATPDENALLVAQAVLKALKERPPKSKEWLQKRDEMLRERGMDPDEYDHTEADGSG